MTIDENHVGSHIVSIPRSFAGEVGIERVDAGIEIAGTVALDEGKHFGGVVIDDAQGILLEYPDSFAYSHGNNSFVWHNNAIVDVVRSEITGLEGWHRIDDSGVSGEISTNQVTIRMPLNEIMVGGAEFSAEYVSAFVFSVEPDTHVFDFAGISDDGVPEIEFASFIPF